MGFDANGALAEQGKITGPESLAAAAAPIKRPTYVYRMPSGLAAETGVSEVALVELTAEEELLATKRARGDAIRLGFELAKESLRRVDRANLSTVDGTADIVWNRMPAKVRLLVVSAYGDIHGPKEGEAADFLKSRAVTVG